MKKKHVAFLNTHPIQYFAPLYAYLNASDEFAISALYLSDYSIRGVVDKAFGRVVKWDVDLLAGYDARFVTGANRRGESQGFFSMVVPALWGELRRSRFDALVVHGHTPAAMLVGVAAAKASGIPVFMRGETHLGLNRSAIKAVIRRPTMGALYACLDGVLAIGSANAAFYRAMGVPEHRIFSMPYTVDNARFAAGSLITSSERAQIRARLGVKDDRPIVLYAAKFQSRKRPADLLRAVARLRQDKLDFQLAMVGSGELEVEVRELADTLGLVNVHFSGFVNQSTLPKIYAASDIFVLPSENEPWGLAVNEAMCAGLPILASSEIGCVPDLVKDGVNGRTFCSGDVVELTNTLRSLLQDGQRSRRMGVASREIISHWSYAECRDGLRAALAGLDAGDKSVGTSRNRAPASDNTL